MFHVEETVKALLLKILDITEKDITPVARFTDDLKATSIDMIEIISILQNTFDVDVEESEIARLRIVQDVIDLFETALARKQSNSL